MPISNVGAPSAATVLGYLDALSSVVKPAPGMLGQNASTETTTLSALASGAATAILALGDAGLASDTDNDLISLILALRWDTIFKVNGLRLMRDLESRVSANLPAGWNLTPAGSQHVLDGHLLRLNACHSGVPLTPTAAGVLTAVNNAGGTLQSVASGNALRLVHTLIGANRYDESLPCPEATQVALTGAQNAYSYQIGSAVPTGVTKIGIYRSYVAGATSVYFWLKDVAVNAGSAYPAILITEPDAALRLDWRPPAWLSCLPGPDAALLFALAFATAQTGALAPDQMLTLSSGAMLSAANVLLGPANGILGYQNPAQSGIFATWAAGTFAAGTLQAANNAAAGLQGFAGAIGLRARVTSAIDSAGTPSLSYTYFDAAHGYGNPQTQASVAADAALSGTAVGFSCVWTIPAGRLVQSITGFTAGGATTGAMTLEANRVRSY